MSSILHAGIHKSGNFWLSRILRRINHHAGREHSSWVQRHPIHATALTWQLSYAGQADMDFMSILPDGCYWRISDVYRERVENVDEYVRACSHVWCHSPIIPRSLEVLPLFDKIVYLIRDPRDIAVSLSRFVFTPHVRRNWPPHFEKDPESFLKHALDGELRDWVAHVGGWLSIRPRIPFHVVFYERLRHDFDAEVQDLLGYLEVDLPDRAVDAIRHEVSFEIMHGSDPDHVRKGRTREWVRALSERQKVHAIRVAGGMLELLRYPIAADADEGSLNDLPRLPRRIDADLLKRAVAQAERGPLDEVRRVAGFVLGDRSLQVKANRVRLWARDTLFGRSS